MQLDIVPWDSSLCVGELYCCKASMLPVLDLYYLNQGLKREGEERWEVHLNPWFSVSSFPGESCWEFGEAGTS